MTPLSQGVDGACAPPIAAGLIGVARELLFIATAVGLLALLFWGICRNLMRSRRASAPKADVGIVATPQASNSPVQQVRAAPSMKEAWGVAFQTLIGPLRFYGQWGGRVWLQAWGTSLLEIAVSLPHTLGNAAQKARLSVAIFFTSPAP